MYLDGYEEDCYHKESFSQQDNYYSSLHTNEATMHLGNGTTETNWPLQKTWTLQKSHASTLHSSRLTNRAIFGERILGLIVRDIENIYSDMNNNMLC